MESLLSSTGGADRMEDFIENKEFREPNMEASIAMDLCFSSACECQMSFFPIAGYLLGLSSKQIFMSV